MSQIKNETIEQKVFRYLRRCVDEYVVDLKSKKIIGDLHMHELASMIQMATAEEREADSWQPIETAPKDGTEVDLWCGRERYTDCQWQKKEWCEWRYDDFDSLALLPVDIPATHWMPLPAAPKDEVSE